MTTLDLARAQFASTTIYHFLFVPLSIGLALFVAICQTLHHRTGNPVYDRMARFWGKLFLISFVLGVATGIVQEFQFGMNWSSYSRYVGDVFGAPLAMEALVSFFLESTFLGVWIFGRGRLSPRLHLASIWAVAIGSMISAYFILAANSWMQHPVGYRIDPVTHHAVLTSIFKVLTNSTVLLAFPHTIFAAFATGGGLVVAVCAYHLIRRRDLDVFVPSIKIASTIVVAGVLATMVCGHFMGMLLERQQPMKMASAEALFPTERGASFSLFATGSWTPNPKRTNIDVRIPHALSILATGTWNGTVKGINQLNREAQQKYGPGNYTPVVGVTYWSFRVMIGTGTLMLVLGLLALWRQRQGTLLERRRLLKVLVYGASLPFISNSAGWVFAELGRQPWVVQGLLLTRNAVSPTVNSTSLAITLIGFVALYGVLAAIGGALFVRTIKAGPDPQHEPDAAGDEHGRTPGTPPIPILAY